MLNLYVQVQNLLARLRASQEGVVSFEYVIVAACIVAAVAAAFGGGTGPIVDALTAGINAISGALTNAVASP